MSDDPPTPTEPNDDPGRRPHWLRTLLSALDSLERRSGSPSNRRETDVRVNYDLSVDPIRDAFEARRSETGSTRGGPHGGRPSGERRQRSSSSVPTSVTTRSYDDELVVTADVPGIDPDEIIVGFDDSALVVGAAGTEVDRVDVPWADRTATASVNNGVLTVSIEPADGDAGVGTETGGER